jgi:hypothetical protein
MRPLRIVFSLKRLLTWLSTHSASSSLALRYVTVLSGTPTNDIPNQLPNSESRASTSTRQSHGSSVCCLSVHGLRLSSNTYVIATLYSGHVYIWSYETQQVVKTFELTDVPVRAGRFIARKNWIVCGSDDLYASPGLLAAWFR